MKRQINEIRAFTRGVVTVLCFMPGVGVVVGWAPFSLTAVAQTNSPWPKSFEVVSVKPAKSGGSESHINTSPDRLSCFNIPLSDIILFAYAITSNQLEGVPPWAKSERYTIEAVAPAGTAEQFQSVLKLPADQRSAEVAEFEQSFRQMIQSLLADRFKLKVTRALKQMPVYELVVSKGGPKLKPASAEDLAAAGRPPGSGVWSNSRPGYFKAINASSAYLAGSLSKYVSEELGRQVIDRTGLTGTYDFTLTWTPSQTEQGMNPKSLHSADVDSPGPSIFTAIQEQLGLKLQPAKGPIEVLVIDHVEQPTPN